MRVMLVGIDCVPPGLAFSRYRDELPCLSALVARGSHARLRSTFPPITVPAWTAMVSGRDPGELGLYGFRARTKGSYGLSLVGAADVTCDRVWDVLSRHGKRSSVLFVPPSYPAPRVQGELVSCFLTPDDADDCTWPRTLKGELEARFGRYIPDVEVRHGELEGLTDELVRMTEQHFAMACHVWRTREPDFLMMVEIGPDRLHHALWAHLDETHPRHDPNSPFRDEARRYYRALDRALATLVAQADDDTAIVIASDHGARPLEYAFHINVWLERHGYLVLREQPERPAPLSPELVDWSRTRAWAEGGYYARVFLNVAGREPRGIVPEAERERLRDTLRAELSAVPGRDGEALFNRVESPEALYRAVRGAPPDLLAVFGDLAVRPLSTVGTRALYAEGDDRGADGCNHDWDGIFVVAGRGVTPMGDLGTVAIHDVGATVLSLFDVVLPADWLGTDRSRP